MPMRIPQMEDNKNEMCTLGHTQTHVVSVTKISTQNVQYSFVYIIWCLSAAEAVVIDFNVRTRAPFFIHVTSICGDCEYVFIFFIFFAFSFSLHFELSCRSQLIAIYVDGKLLKVAFCVHYIRVYGLHFLVIDSFCCCFFLFCSLFTYFAGFMLLLAFLTRSHIYATTSYKDELSCVCVSDTETCSPIQRVMNSHNCFDRMLIRVCTRHLFISHMHNTDKGKTKRQRGTEGDKVMQSRQNKIKKHENQKHVSIAIRCSIKP